MEMHDNNNEKEKNQIIKAENLQINEPLITC